MTAQQLIDAGIILDSTSPADLLAAEAALDWIRANTIITETLENLPAGAKLFIIKYCSAIGTPIGVASESIDGLSQSFSGTDKQTLILELAQSLLGSYLNSQVTFTPAKRKWLQVER